jgi:hypothetical protein
VIFLQKLFMSVVLTLICGIPTWLFLGIRYLSGPEGFWQNFALIIIYIWIGGVFQFILFFIWISGLLALWNE